MVCNKLQTVSKNNRSPVSNEFDSKTEVTTMQSLLSNSIAEMITCYVRCNGTLSKFECVASG